MLGDAVWVWGWQSGWKNVVVVGRNRNRAKKMTEG